MKVEVDPQAKLRTAIRKAAREGGDLTVPLTLIGQQWFKSNRAIFALKGPGKYPDLTERYKKFKERHLGSAYPILKLTGRLEGSITDPSDGDAVMQIINNSDLLLGTTVPYANFHQNPGESSPLPRRPMVLFGNEQVAPGALSRRVKQWEETLLNWVAGKVGAE